MCSAGRTLADGTYTLTLSGRSACANFLSGAACPSTATSFVAAGACSGASGLLGLLWIQRQPASPQPPPTWRQALLTCSEPSGLRGLFCVWCRDLSSLLQMLPICMQGSGSAGQGLSPTVRLASSPVLSATVRADAANGLQRWRITYLAGTNGLYTITLPCGHAACNQYLSSSATCGTTVVDIYSQDDGSGRQEWQVCREMCTSLLGLPGPGTDMKGWIGMPWSWSAHGEAH